MARQVPQRRTSTAAAVLVGMLLLAVPATATAAHGDRPPAHAGSGQTPPEHAHAAAPEDRPPAHARARRASTRPGAGARSGHGATSPASPGSQGPSGGPRPAAPPPHAAAPTAPRGDGPPAGAPAHGRTEEDPEPTGDGTDPGTELDTDLVVDGPAPTPDRAPTTAGGPVLSTSPPLAVVASTLLGVSPSTPFSGVGTDATDTGTVGGADGTGADAGPEEDAGSARDRLAAPRTRSVPPPFGTPELTRRVVVPVVVLVAGLIYLLAQGRIDRRGVLLLAPSEPGTEGDDEVFEL